MKHVSTHTAYVRKGVNADDPSIPLEDLRGSVVEEQVWVLLQTPQTVESLREAVRESAHGDEAQTEGDYFERMLERLLNADLIEVAQESSATSKSQSQSADNRSSL
jgi:hypothetical protein